MKTISFSNWAVKAAFGSAILVLLGLGTISYRGIALSGEGDRLVRHTDEVIENLKYVVFGMETVSASIRGFALTARKSYLDTFRVAKLNVERHMDAIRTLTADNPEQQLKLAMLEKLAITRFRRAEVIIDLRRSQGLQATADEINLGPGQQIGDQVQTIALQLSDEEQRLMKQRTADAAQRLNQTKLLLMLGTVLGVVITLAAAWSVLRDSSRRSRAERALRDSEEQYRMLLDGIQDKAIFMMDPNGQVVNWNAGAEQINGYRSDEIIGRNFSCFFLPEDIARGRPGEVLRLAAASDDYHEQGTRLRKDGSQFIASVTLTALRDAAGELQGFSEFSHDLSKGKRSEARYRGLLEAAPDAMVVVNQQGEIVLLNAQAENQFGYRRDELLGQQVTNIIPEGFAERLIADDLRSADDALSQQIGTGIELTGRRKDGSGFPIEIMLSPLESAEGMLVTAAIRNISVRKDAETHLAQMEGRYRGLLEAAPGCNGGGEPAGRDRPAECRGREPVRLSP